MLKIKNSHSCKSFFRNNDLYDTERTKERVVKIFGETIYHNTNSYNLDLKDIKDTTVGFSKK